LDHEALGRAIDQEAMIQEAMEVSIDVKAIDQGVIEGAMDGISD